MWFKNKESDLETQLVDMYATMKSSVLGLSKDEGQKMARQMLLLAKEKVKQYHGCPNVFKSILVNG